MTGLQEIPKKITSNSQDGRRVLKSWEERLAEVMASGPSEAVVPSGPPPVGQRCFILGCMEWPVDVAYCRSHREMADSGSLWESRR